ncbi:MAG: hypothetical protein ABIW19_14585 [Vicinamibacterales bacterium]
MGRDARAQQGYEHAGQIAIFAALCEQNLALADQAKCLLDLALEGLDTRQPMPQTSIESMWSKAAQLEGYIVSQRAQLAAFRDAIAQLQKEGA